MTKMIFVNLPVTDLARSKDFYAAVGARNEPKFTDATATMMSFSTEINVMLLTYDKWREFTSKTIPDPRTHAQVLLALSADSRGDVDALVETAIAAGGTADPVPTQEYGEMMYGRSFEDPDGHIWEVMWMAAEAAEQGASALEEA